jgi:hypothetical protein
LLSWGGRGVVRIEPDGVAEVTYRASHGPATLNAKADA